MTRKEQLVESILTIQEELKAETDQVKAGQKFAELMATAIEDAILASTVNVDGDILPVE